MIIIIGIILGFVLKVIIEKVSDHIVQAKFSNSKTITSRFFQGLIILVTVLLSCISYQKFGFNIVFLKAALLDCILIVVSFIDYKFQIIPNNIVIIALILSLFFSFFADITLKEAIIGMTAGGGILFLLALVPGTLGGGDIKFMFAMGGFLGISKVIVAIFLGFTLAALVSIILLLFKLKSAKDYIPFGPFLAIGCFFVFHFTLF